MLLPLHKFITLVNWEGDDNGRPIFFFVNKFPDDNQTEISVVKLKHLNRGDGELIYEPDWEIVEEVTAIQDSDLHNIMAFDANRDYLGGSYLRWRGKNRNVNISSS